MIYCSAPLLLHLLLLLLHLDNTHGQQSTDAASAICSKHRTCSSCTPVDGCGWCLDVLTSGDGTAKEIVNTCVATNATHPGSPPEGRRCNAGFHAQLCPCPNQCSSHGVCDPEGACQCFRAYSGEDCATEKQTVMQAGVVVPLAIVSIGALGTALVFLHLRQSGEARQGSRRVKKRAGSRRDGTSSAAEVSRGIVMKSQYPRYTDAIN